MRDSELQSEDEKDKKKNLLARREPIEKIPGNSRARSQNQSRRSWLLVGRFHRRGLHLKLTMLRVGKREVRYKSWRPRRAGLAAPGKQHYTIMLNIPIKKGKQVRAQRITIYGVEGIGKSTLAASAPNPLFIDTEMGTAQLDVARVEAYEFEHVVATIQALLMEEHEYKTLVLDTADNLKRYCEEVTLRENKWNSLETPGFGKGFRMAFEKFKLLVNLLDQLIFRGIHVLNICHAKVLRINPPDTSEYNKYCLKVSDSNKDNDDSRLFLKEWSDCVLFCNYDTTVSSSQQKATKHERVIHTTSSPAWEAKNRYNLPETMPMTAESMRAIFKAAQGEAQKPAQQPAPAQEEEISAQERAIAMASDEDVLTDYFVGTGTLRPGQTLADLPANIAADLKARPEHAMYRALMWCEKYGNKDTSEVLARLETRSWKGEQAPAPAQPQGYEQAVKREREVLTAFFVGTGKLQPGQTLEDLPANIAAALKARPQLALDRALEWCKLHGKEVA